MNRQVTLKNISPDGTPLQVTYLPDQGMNLISYCIGPTEVIDQSTYTLFEKRFAGLGPLIGPHFHMQKDIPSNFDPSLFPHIACIQAEGRKDPFSHGIARYVPWKTVESETQIKAKLRGSDLYKGVPLSTFEGQDFEMTYEARLLSTGLHIVYKLESEKPSVIGLHYYYRLPRKGEIHGEIAPLYRDKDTWKSLPDQWIGNKKSQLQFCLPQIADFGFIPKKKHTKDHLYEVILNTDDYSLHTKFNTCSNQDFSYQVFHPEGASYVCVEPLSTKTPTTPSLKSNTLEIHLQVFI